MKEIGEKLKETRESMGISIEEASEDLKVKPSQLTDIEEGNKEAFKDVHYLKYFIRDYSKYLGLDYEAMVEEFNEFVFDYTSKISIDDIKKATNKNKEKNNVKKIVSPYTIDKENEKKIPKSVIIGIIIALLCVAIYVVVYFVTKDKDKKDDNDINSKDVSYIYNK
jgi:cytoskeletal protein RodZ